MERRPNTWLELDLDHEAIAGSLHAGDDPPRAFCGWLELVALLEDARAQRAEAAEAAASGEAPPPGA